MTWPGAAKGMQPHKGGKAFSRTKKEPARQPIRAVRFHLQAEQAQRTGEREGGNSEAVAA
tara:strand:- start:3687 stop:3866 length:180 start_codon:yes stop_codon:yes gene_type:complete